MMYDYLMCNLEMHVAQENELILVLQLLLIIPIWLVIPLCTLREQCFL